MRAPHTLDMSHAPSLGSLPGRQGSALDEGGSSSVAEEGSSGAGASRCASGSSDVDDGKKNEKVKMGAHQLILWCYKGPPPADLGGTPFACISATKHYDFVLLILNGALRAITCWQVERKKRKRGTIQRNANNCGAGPSGLSPEQKPHL